MSDLPLLDAYARAFYEGCAEEVVALDVGVCYLNHSLPRMYDLNALLAERPDAGFDALAHAADEVLGGAGRAHRKVVVPDEDAGAKLAGAAQGRSGWDVTRLLDMTWDEDPGGDDGIAEEMSLSDLRELRERQNRAFFGNDEDLMRQFLTRDHLYARAGDGRFFGVRDDRGVVQSGLNLFRIGDVAEIDDVQTAEAARGRGYARAALLKAARAARAGGAKVVFLSADEDDWPKALYATLGFVVARRRFEFLRAPRR